MVYKSVDHVVDLFFTITFIFYEKPKTKQPALRDMLRHFRGLYSFSKIQLVCVLIGWATTRLYVIAH